MSSPLVQFNICCVVFNGTQPAPNTPPIARYTVLDATGLTLTYYHFNKSCSSNNSDTFDTFDTLNCQVSDNIQGKSTQKKDNNGIFNDEFIHKSVRYANAMSMYIEGVELRTTRMLLAAGFPASRCIIVNDQIKDASIIPTGANFKQGASFSKAIDLLTPYQLDNLRVVWYDGCNTVLGNVADRKHHPNKDIFKLLSKMKNDFTLFVTYAMRTNLRKDRVRKALKGLNTDDSETDVEDYKLHPLKKCKQLMGAINKRQKRADRLRQLNTKIHEALYALDRRSMKEKQIAIITKTIEMAKYNIKESPTVIKYKSQDEKKGTNMVFIKFELIKIT